MSRIRHEKYHEIAAVAELKAGQIVAWRQERLADVERLARDPLLIKAEEAFLANPNAPTIRETLLARLRSEQLEDFDDVLLLDPTGRVLLAAKADSDPLDPATQSAIEAAIASRKPQLSDLYRCPHNQVHLDAVAPVFDQADQIIALAALRSNAEDVLYPLIQSWPTPSRTAETLLVRREGQEALFLNALRHQSGTALSLRRPLSATHIPAVQAVLGQQGMFEGDDYRGVKVLADLRPVPGSPWFIVAKVDAREILAEANYRARMIALFLALGILLTAASANVVWRRQQEGLYRSLYQAEQQEREAQERFRATVYSIGDAVITTDRAGRVQHLNPAAEQLTGWAEDEARGQPLEQVFHIINEETRAAVESPAQRVLREGMVVGLANHTVLIARDGTERPIADSGAPIRDAAGGITGVVLVFRDQTEERLARRALRQWADAFEHCGHGIAICDPATNRILACNPAFARLHRCTAQEIVGVPIAALYAPQERERVRQFISEADQTGRAQYETLMIRKDGSTFPVQMDLVAVRDDDGAPLYRVATAEDITERRRAEAALRESEERYRAIVSNIPGGLVHVFDREFRYVFNAGEELARLGLSNEMLVGKSIHDILPSDVAPLVEAAYQRVLQGETVRFDGPYGDDYFHVVAAPLRDAAGQVSHILALSINITERKRAELEKQKFFLIAESSSEFIGMCDLDMQPIYVNPAGQHMVGLPDMAAACRVKVQDYFFPEDQKFITEEFFPRVLREGYGDVEIRLRHFQTGEPIWMFYYLFHVRDARGHLIGWATVSHNITERKRAEEKLRESEERYRLLVDRSPYAISIHQDGKIVFANWAAAKLLRAASPEDLAGLPISRIVHPDTWAAARDRIERMLQGEDGLYPVEDRYVRLDGAVVPVQVTAAPFTYQGRPAIQVIALDITAQKQAEEQLRENNYRLNILNHVGLALAETQDLTTIYRVAHQHIAEMVDCPNFAISLYDPTTQTLRASYVSSDGEEMDVSNLPPLVLQENQALAGRARAILTQQPTVMNDLPAAPHKTIVVGDSRLPRSALYTPMLAQGRTIGLLEVQSYRDNAYGEKEIALLGPVANQVGLAIENARLLADLRTDRDALARERALLRTMIDNLPDAIYVKDAQARKVLANRADWSRIGAASEEEVLGKTDRELFAPDMAERLMADDLMVLQTGQALIDREEKLETAQGEPVWQLTSKLPLKDAEGRVIGLVGIGHNITERKRAEEERDKLQAQLVQAQKMEAVGRLAGGVAHDFNNMLSIINGYSEMAMESLDPADPLYADLREIVAAGRRSADLTRQLLAFARRQTIAPKPLDLNEAVESMLKMLRRLIGEDIDLIWKPAAHLWPVLMDPAQLDQILANLTVNARDAIAGVGKLTIETGQVEFDELYCANHLYAIPGEYVMLAVSDDGCGMDKATLARLFEPFFTTKPQGQGTGLGLATVYGIVKQNNGFINVYSEPGHGATFKIYLPRHHAEAQPATAQARPQAATGAETVLLVEDDPALLKFGAKMVEQLGYTVLAGNTPIEALRIIQEYAGDIHLLLTDVVMPDMSGRDLWEKVRALRPMMKCLYMSGYTANVIAHHGVLDAGIHFVQKPFIKTELAAKLREALETP